jgi:hypothetical protein
MNQLEYLKEAMTDTDDTEKQLRFCMRVLALITLYEYVPHDDFVKIVEQARMDVFSE